MTVFDYDFKRFYVKMGRFTFHIYLCGIKDLRKDAHSRDLAEYYSFLKCKVNIWRIIRRAGFIGSFVGGKYR